MAPNPIVFIAVQCFQCSTMQVKQRKKSSNKWTCAVCNQKQSLTRVFAQGFIAKDIRSFVQSFNMSRNCDSLSPQTLSHRDDVSNIDLSAKRSDWTEYLDPQQHSHHQGGDGDGDEVKVVTEYEKGMFKKPRLQNYSSGSHKLFKPTFSSRNTNKNIISKGEMVKSKLALSEDNYKQQGDGGFERCRPTIRKESCKWKDYMTEEEDSLQLRWRKGFKDNTDQGTNSVLEAITNEEIVEEDVHPDFM